MKKRVLGMLLAFSMVITSSFLFLPTFAQGSNTSILSYLDISEHWAKDAVNRLQEKNPIPFREEKLFPDQAIKRFEFAMILHDALNININYFKEPSVKDYFDDIKQDAPYASAVIDLVTANVFSAKGSFEPNATLTKEKMLHYIMQAYSFVAPDDGKTIKIGPASFKDTDMIDPEYSGELARAQYYGLIIGNENNLFLPKKAATRAEAIVVISRLLAIVENKNQLVSVVPQAVLSDESLEMKLIINNNTNEDITITHTSGQKFDFVLLDADRKEVYRWSADKLFIMALTTTKIEAGKTIVFDHILSGDEFTPIKENAVSMKAYITGNADFVHTDGYEITIK